VASATDTDLLYLGTADGQIFRSVDGARTWQRLKPGLEKRGLSVDHIVLDPRDPRTLYAGAWAVARDEEGGVFKSTDGGEHWKLLDATKKMSVRSLALAPSDSNFLIAGSANDDPNLNGVFRSMDGGRKWERISPVGDKEIRNIQSVAVDPRNVNVIYVGTWHLPWKTTDGGSSWKQTGYKAVGMIDDSDIFGISVNPANPDLVFVNACSGIYRSASRGEKWAKVPGIPFSARRTYKLLVHPSNPKVIFAGTSEGLWRSKDDGKRWMLLTSKSLVIRSIVVTPDKPNRVIIATDDSGIRVSEDLGDDFRESNTGFIHRHVLAIMPDSTERGRLLASVFHDNSGGSVFSSTDSGESWQSSSRGLGARDVFSFYQMPDNAKVIYAGTNNGVYRSNDRGASWAFTGVEHVKKPEKIVKPPVRTRRNTRSTSSKRRAVISWPATQIGRYQTVAAVQQTVTRNSKKPSQKHSAKKEKAKGVASAAANPSAKKAGPRVAKAAPKKQSVKKGTPAIATSAPKKHSVRRGSAKAATSASKNQPARSAKPVAGTDPNPKQPVKKERPLVGAGSSPKPPGKKKKEKALAGTVPPPTPLVKKEKPLAGTVPSTKPPVKKEKPLVSTSPPPTPPSSRRAAPAVTTSPVQRPVVASVLAPGFFELTREVDDITSFTDGEGHVALLAATIDGLYRTFDESRGWSKVYINGCFHSQGHAEKDIRWNQAGSLHFQRRR
jgi:photosystem II stability/assembly factor-like uncharacterized protein